MAVLEIKDLHVSVDGKQIVKGVSLVVRQGEIHALMGPNGSGKSSLALAIMGHPKYKIESGDVLLDGQSILSLSPDKRAKLGLFLAMQYPTEIPGVQYTTFLRSAYSALKEKVSVMEFKEILQEHLPAFKFSEEFLNRNLNEGFSGGEKKRAEILQLAILKPRFAVLDETDSGLDIDALKNVAERLNQLADSIGILLITHYQRILNYLRPHFVHVMVDGRIMKSGGEELAKALESEGYEKFLARI
jgi:Fe-S cluster assembly ATP-binding protein